MGSFLKLGQTLFIFQFIIADKMVSRKKWKNPFQKSRLLDVLPPKANWRFVFITPGHKVDVKATPAVEAVQRFLIKKSF